MNFSKKICKSYEQSDEEFSYNGSNGSYVESEDDSEYQPSSKKTRTISNVSGSKGSNQITRRPTRVPNLKIQNRNALLARENRKRKKEMVDNLEQTVNDVQVHNKKLLKMMKMKDAQVMKLEQEVRYLKSVIANRTEIVTVLKSLPKFPTKVSGFTDTKEELPKSTGSETASCETFDDNDLEVATEWDEILHNPFNASTDFSDIPKLDDIGFLSPASSLLSEISTEHNYYEKMSSMGNDSGAGVCVHINSGRVSLEFCSTCHYNATNTWISNN